MVGYVGTGELNVSAAAAAGAASDVSIGAMAGSTGTATVAGAGSILTAGRDLFVGNAGNGELTVSAGGAVTAGREFNIGWQAGSQGVVLVDGAGSSLTTRSLVLGQLGTGTLTVSNGASVEAATDVLLGTFGSGSGRIDVTGAGSSLKGLGWMAVGSHGQGELNVSNGAAVDVGRYLVMGEGIGQGVVNVTGAGSILSVGETLRVGANGRGDLTVSGGAKAGAGTDIIIAEQAGSTGTATVTGAGSTLTAGRGLVVGNAGSGTLTVSDGGSVGAGYIGVGHSTGGEGVATVTGAGSSLTSSGNLDVGLGGRGKLTVSNGGAARGNVVVVGGDGEGVVAVTGAGSSLTAVDYLTIGGVTASGELTIADGASATTRGATIGELAGGPGTLTVSGGGAFAAAEDINVGLNAGSTGATTVTGAGSTLTAGRDLYVGRNGNGQLTVSDGAAANVSGRIYVGQTGGQGGVTVTGAGSSLVSTGVRMDVGGLGRGDLTVSNGGTVVVERLGIHTNGVVNVTGAGSSLKSANWIDMTNGDMTVAGGGVVSAGDNINLATGVGTHSLLDVAGTGSSVSTTGLLHVGINGTGELNVRDGARVDAQRGFILARDAAGVGTLTVGGASGSAATGAGTLNGAITFGAGDGRLIFNHNSVDYAYTGAVGGTTAGQGRIRFEAGRTRFNTTDAGFTGVSDIFSGASLYLNGALGGTLNVRAGGELLGVGTVGNLNVDGVVRMAGDNAYGRFTGTSARFNAGSVFTTDFFGTNADSIVVSGTANIANGAILRVTRPANAIWKAGDRATVLSAAGGLTGRFTLEGASAPLSAFLGLRDGYTATTAYLEIAQVRDFAAAAQTANQTGVASGIQSVGSTSALFNAIANMPNDAAAQTAFTALSGELHPGVRSIVARDGYRLQQAVVRNGSTTDARDAGARVWGEAWTSDGEVKSDGNAERLDYDTTGFIVGSDVHFAGGWRLGAALAFDEGDVDSGRSQGHADLSRRSVLAYLDGQLAGFELKGGLGYTNLGVKTNRVAAFASPVGAFNETLKGDYDGSIGHAYVDASYPLAFGNAQVAPFVNLSRVAVSTDAHSETGGLAALNVGKTDADLTFSTVGLRVGGVSFIGASVTGSAGWRRATGDRDAMGLMAFKGGSVFRAYGPEISQNAAVVDLGAEWKPVSNLSIGAGVSYVGGGDESDKGARLSLRYSF